MSIFLSRLFEFFFLILVSVYKIYFELKNNLLKYAFYLSFCVCSFLTLISWVYLFLVFENKQHYTFLLWIYLRKFKIGTTEETFAIKYAQMFDNSVKRGMFFFFGVQIHKNISVVLWISLFKKTSTLRHHPRAHVYKDYKTMLTSKYTQIHQIYIIQWQYCLHLLPAFA